MSSSQTDKDDYATLLRNLNQYLFRFYSPTIRPTVEIIDNLSCINRILFRQILVTRWSTREDEETAKPVDLAYTELLNVVAGFIDVLSEAAAEPKALCEVLLNTMKHLACLIPVTSYDSLMYTTASTLGLFSENLRERIMDCLCNDILPVCLMPCIGAEDRTIAEYSVPSVIMTVLQHCQETIHHVHLITTLMTLKDNVCEDLLEIIANGIHTVRGPAVRLLFYFWPIPTGTSQQELELGNKTWPARTCQVKDCPTPQNVASKMCLDGSFAAECGSCPPPLYMCKSCLHHLEDRDGKLPTINIPQVAASSSSRGLNGWGLDGWPQPSVIFNGVREIEIKQKDIPDPWDMYTSSEQQLNLLQSICQLLDEASPTMFGESNHSSNSSLTEMDDEEDRVRFSSSWLDTQYGKLGQEDRRILSRYGILLMTHKCTPHEPCDPSFIGQLIAAVILWLHNTRKLPEGPVGVCLGPLKHTQIKNWLTVVCETNFSTLCQCLEPDPPMFACVGGCWKTLTSYVTKYKEGMSRIFTVITENIFSFDRLLELWQYVMPSWMESIKAHISITDLNEFQTEFRDLFPMLSIPDEHKYEFIHRMFRETGPKEQGQAIFWIQNMTRLKIRVPKLNEMFLDGVHSPYAHEAAAAFPFSHCPVVRLNSTPMSSNPGTPVTSASSLKEVSLDINTPCNRYVLMLDLLVEQRALRDSTGERPFDSDESNCINKLLAQMLNTKWGGEHQGDHSESYNDCMLCQSVSLWFQLAYQLLRRTCTTNTTDNLDSVHTVSAIFGATVRVDTWSSDYPTQTAPVAKDSSHAPSRLALPDESKSDISLHSGSSVEVLSKDFKVKETDGVDRQLNGNQEIAVELENPLTSQDQLMTEEESEEDIADDTNSGKRPRAPSAQQKRMDYARTGVFRRKEVLPDMPLLVKLLIGCLSKLESQCDVDVMCSVVKCIEVLCLRGDCLTLAKNYDVHLLEKVQTLSLIPSLWHVLRAQHSYLSEACVPVLLHCLSYPYAAEMLWEEVKEAFNHMDWRIRFNAVEKAIVLGQFLKEDDIKIDANQTITASSVMSTLALVFSHLISAMEDICPSVATRAVVLLKTIKPPSLKLLFSALEHQFKFEPLDRPLILQRMHILNNILPDMPALTVTFFSNMLKHLKEEGTCTHLTDVYDGFSQKYSERRHSISCTSKKTTFQHKSISSPLPAVTMSIGFLSSCSTETGDHSGGSDNQVQPNWKTWDATLDDYVNMVLKVTRHGQNKADGQAKSQFVICPEAGETSQNAIKHQLITLLMQFMTNHSPSPTPTLQDERMSMLRRSTSVGRTRSADQKLLNELQSSLGYPPHLKVFNQPPSKLRQLPEFSAYMLGVADVLDQNIAWGERLLSFTLRLLLHCPAPSHDAVPKSEGDPLPDYSLALLTPSLQSVWLVILVIILYKYEDLDKCIVEDSKGRHYAMTDYKWSIEWLLEIAMNTLCRPFHFCPPRFVPAPPRFLERQSYEMSESSRLTRSGDSSSSVSTSQEPITNSNYSSGSSAVAARSQTPARHSNCSRPESELSQITRLEFSSLDSPTLLPILEGPGSSGNGKERRSSMKKGRGKWTTMMGDAGLGRRPSVVNFTPETKGGLGDQNDDDKETHHGQPAIQESNKETENGMEAELVESVASSKRRGSALSSSSSSSSLSHSSFTSSRVSGTGGLGLAADSRSISFSDGVFCSADIERVCPGCEGILEGCSEDVACLAIIAVGTFTRRCPEHSATFLRDIIDCIARMATAPLYPWQDASNVLVTPSGSSVAIARQFLRCSLLQFAGNGLFVEIFHDELSEQNLMKAIALSLPDKGSVPPNYPGLTLCSPVVYVLEDFAKHPRLSDPNKMLQMIRNMAIYIENLPQMRLKSWQEIFPCLQRLFRKLPDIYSTMDSDFKRDYRPAMKLMICTLQVAKNSDLDRSLLRPFSKLLSQVIEESAVSVATLWFVCSQCYMNLIKDRDREKLTGIVMEELESGLRFKKDITMSCLLNLVKFVCVDSGAYIGEVIDMDGNSLSASVMAGQTGARNAVLDILPAAASFLSDRSVYTKQRSVGNTAQQLKTAVAQMIGIELYRGDEAMQKIFPWLQSGDAPINDPHEVITRLLTLCWVLLGAIAYHVSTLTVVDSIDNIVPFREEMSENIAVQCSVVIEGLIVTLKEEAWSERVTILPVMFEVCKLWTVYCEVFFPSHLPATCLTEFWSTVTVSVLHALSVNSNVATTDSWKKSLPRHLLQPFVSMVDSLQALAITSMSKLLPRWLEMFSVFETDLVAPLRDHLQDFNFLSQHEVKWDQNDIRLLKWLLEEQYVLAALDQNSKT